MSGAKIMEPSNWPSEWLDWDLTEYRRGFLSGRAAAHWLVNSFHLREPLGVFSLSDGDCAFWAYFQMRERLQDAYWLEYLMRTSGLNQEGLYGLSDEFDESVRSLDAWLLQYHWEPAERFTIAALDARGARTGPKIQYGKWHMKVACNVIYQLHHYGLWWALLHGRKLCVVSARAAEVAQRLTDSEFVSLNGGKVTWDVECLFKCPGLREPKTAYWRGLQKQLADQPWDLLLCSAGSLSALICAEAQRLGRQALDIGAFDTVLLGEKHNCVPVPMLAGG